MLASSSRAGVGTPKRVGSATSAGAGYITDEQFRNSFEAVPVVQVYLKSFNLFILFINIFLIIYFLILQLLFVT